MISPLTQKILKLAEFDESAAKDAAQFRWDTWEKGAHVITYQVEAARYESARLTPLLMALAEVAGATQRWRDQNWTLKTSKDEKLWDYLETETLAAWDAVETALAKLAAVMGEIE